RPTGVVGKKWESSPASSSGLRTLCRVAKVVANPNGTPETLVPAPTGNTIAVKHAVYSPRLREPRAREIAEVVLSAPWATDLDAISALELGRILALIERLDEAIGDNLATASVGAGLI